MQKSLIQILGQTKLMLGTLLLTALGISVAALIFFGWLTEEMLEGETLRFDNSVRAFVHQYASPWLTSLMQLFSFLGSTLFLTMASGAALITFWLLKRRHAATLLAITMIGGAIFLTTLKNIFRRARPEPFFNLVLPSSYSFPSGHSLLSFCFYGALAAIVTRRVEQRSIKIIVWTIAFLMIGFVGISRIYLGVHYPSDVLAGYTAALIWVVAIAVTDRLWRHRKEKTNKKNAN